MNINITARNFKISEELRELINDKLQKLHKYDSRITNIDIILLKESRIRDLFREELSVYGKDFKSFEHPQNFALLAEEWSIDNGLLTPTLKLKREVVEQKFKDQIERLYSD